MFFVESSVTTHMCPICQATLRYRDSRPRIRRKEGGLKDQLIIRRFYCKNCHSYHNELPDCLVPYKHYETEVISGVLDGVVQPEDLDSEDYPSCATMLRWLQWFCENLERINGYLRTIREFLLGYNEERISPGSLLGFFQESISKLVGNHLTPDLQQRRIFSPDPLVRLMHLLCIVCQSTKGYIGLKRRSLSYEYNNKQTTMARGRSPQVQILFERYAYSEIGGTFILI